MKVAVLGLGTIGIKLIEYLAENKINVIAYNFRNSEGKKAKFIETIEKKVKYNKISYEDFEQIINSVHFTSEICDLSDREFLIEAVQEKYEVKKVLYKKIYKVISSSAILATTTSSLSLDTLGNFFCKDRFLGIHFFNPPTKMKLIELSFLPENSLEIKNAIYKFLSAFEDKKVIELPPIQGYVVNNLLFNYINYAIEYRYVNKVDARDVDDAMKLGTNVPMGPLELSDYIGNDISLQILNELYTSTKDLRFKPHPALVQLVTDGALGRKSKQGFYKY